jgi:hypothetical protein
LTAAIILAGIAVAVAKVSSIDEAAALRSSQPAEQPRMVQRVIREYQVVAAISLTLAGLASVVLIVRRFVWWPLPALTVASLTVLAAASFAWLAPRIAPFVLDPRSDMAFGVQVLLFKPWILLLDLTALALAGLAACSVGRPVRWTWLGLLVISDIVAGATLLSPGIGLLLAIVSIPASLVGALSTVGAYRPAK